MRTKPKHKKAVITSLLVTLFMLFNLSGKAQVTIGSDDPPKDFSILEIVSNNKGGLRLPQLTTKEREDVLMKSQAWQDEIIKKGKGLTIYNTTIDCVEYWNKTKWVSLCTGNRAFEKNCTDSPVDATGGQVVCTITDPDCNIAGAYTFTIVSGSDFASILVTDAGAGAFKLTFDPNDRATGRQAIVMVTSPCGISELFVFNQLGDNSGCGTTTVPDIKSIGDVTSMCVGGAIYLHLDGYPTTGTFIWMLNGQIVGTGNNYVATTPGKYIVYGDKIGCPNSKEKLISLDGTGAPAPVGIVVAGNNGLVCSQTDKIKLIALKPATGTVRWFKDGVLQTLQVPDNEILAEVGEWFAVVNDGTCWSTPSNKVIVSVDPNAGTSLTLPVVSKSSGFCAGGSVQLRVNDASYNASYTYTWYENNTILGTGREYLYNVPTGVGSVVIRCRATLSGSCAAEAMSVETITTGTIPLRPTITGDRQLCSGMATLNAVPVGAGTFTYNWYKNGELYATTQTITINSGGEYAVTVTDGCTSPAAKVTISDASSAVPTVTLNRSTDSPNKDDIVTYTASINFNPATAYNWSLNKANLQSGGTGYAYAVVKFENTGSASVKVEVSNACGTGSATHNVTIANDCANPSSVTPSTPTSLSTIVNQGTTLGPVSATFDSGAPQAAYQWYSNTSASNTGGSPISGATGNTYIANKSATGTYYYYCVVKNDGCNSDVLSSGVYTVTVSADPASIPSGDGSFTGKTCFDVVEKNDGGTCGTLTSRQPQKADFTKTETNTQIYTFTTSGTVSKIRFSAVDPNGIIESITPGGSWETATNLSGTYTVTVIYKTDLNQRAAGLDRDDALKATLYAVYNDGSTGSGTDRQLNLTISVRDCACCGAYIAPGIWKEFMCHNLGANYSLDPFTPAAGIHGAKYKFGVKTATMTMAEDQNASYNDAVPNWLSLPYQESGDWDMVNNNPCPDGYRVPTKDEWTGVVSTSLNTQSKPTGASWDNNVTNFSSGKYIGNYLFLPTAGNRTFSHGYMSSRGYGGYYWSKQQFFMGVAETNADTRIYSATYRYFGYSVRCIAK